MVKAHNRGAGGWLEHGMRLQSANGLTEAVTLVKGNVVECSLISCILGTLCLGLEGGGDNKDCVAWALPRGLTPLLCRGAAIDRKVIKVSKQHTRLNPKDMPGKKCFDAHVALHKTRGKVGAL